MRTSNPVLNDNIFSSSGAYGEGAAMTIQGTVNKCLILLALLMAAACWVWTSLFPKAPTVVGVLPQADAGMVGIAMIAAIAGGIIGFIVAIVLAFKKEWSPFLAPVYAVCQGLAMGGISAMFERSYPGIVLQAVALTMGTMFCLLMAYKMRIIRVTEKFRTGVIVATMAIGLVYLVSWVLSFFHIQVPFMVGSSLFSIGFSLFVVGIASMNLVLDFDFIERGAEAGAPKYMEWYSSFGLMVTLVWLYLEILKLLSKLRDRD
jgi:uncharacterized YccA/Bax inhibitor family protein